MSAATRRPPAVAGSFYPGTRAALEAAVDSLLTAAPAPAGPPPKALVLPHAGYVYSGPTAATGYRTLASIRDAVQRVVLMGPAHHVPVACVAVSGADGFDTPLGTVTVDRALRERVLGLPGVEVDDRAHAPEHSLEVHLPFVQRALGDVTILPLIVGRADADTVAGVLDAVWGGDETVVVVSSDLSHYLDQRTASARDRGTADAIVGGRTDLVTPRDACGAGAVRGLMVAAARHGCTPRLLDLRTSADTAGDPARVVGYGAFAFAGHA